MSGLVQMSGGDLWTTTLIVANEFNRSHKNVLKTIKNLQSLGKVNRLQLEPIEYVDEKGRPQPAYRLNERAFLIAMPFLGGRNAVLGQERLVDEFLKMRDALRNAVPRFVRSQEWKLLRHATAASYKVMSQSVQLTRQEQGKGSAHFHFSNEALLINEVALGKREKVNRDLLSLEQLDLIARLEQMNTVLIASGKPTKERKDRLVMYRDELLSASRRISA